MRATVLSVAFLSAFSILPPAVSTASAAGPYDRYVDLQLVLAVDVSGSMDLEEQRVQREGYVRAFRSPEVIKAISSGAYGRIAVTYIEWSSAFYQVVVVPWRIIGDEEEVLQFANELQRSPISREGRTSISGGLLYAGGAFTSSGVESNRRTIDVSGDGANNDGNPIAPAREQLLKQGITINGLPVLLNPSPMLGNVRLDDYYRDCVIGGPGSFIIPVRELSDFAPAIRRKLILEIAMNQAAPAGWFEQVQLRLESGVDCLVGERSRAQGLTP